MISLWKLREKKNVAQMPFVKNTPEFTNPHSNSDSLEFIFGMSKFQLHWWNGGVNSNSNSTELGGFQGIPHV